jgi:hypothetical protein
MISTAGGADRDFGGGSGAEPEGEGGQGEGDDDRDAHGRDVVDQALHLCLSVLRVLDESGHLRELGIGADPGAYDEAAAGVDGGAD